MSPRDHLPSVPSTSGVHAGGETVAVQTAYTLCPNSEPLRAVTAVGRLEQPPDRSTYVAYFTESVSGSDVIPSSELVPLGIDLPSPLMTVVPILSRLFTAVDEGRFDIGWSGYLVGSSIASTYLHALAPVIGARRIVDFDLDAPSDAIFGGPGRDVFLVTESEQSRLTALLASIPDGSLVVLLVPPVGTSPGPVNFYDTIHKKSLTLLGRGGSETTVHERAVRLAEMRLHELPPDLTVREASGDDFLESGDHPGLILKWA